MIDNVTLDGNPMTDSGNNAWLDSFIVPIATGTSALLSFRVYRGDTGAGRFYVFNVLGLDPDLDNVQYSFSSSGTFTQFELQQYGALVGVVNGPGWEFGSSVMDWTQDLGASKPGKVAENIDVRNRGIGDLNYNSSASINWLIRDELLNSFHITETSSGSGSSDSLSGVAVFTLFAQSFHSIIAEAEFFTLTGRAATLQYAQLAGLGSFTYSGQVANLLHSETLIAGQGAFTYTGQNAELLHNGLISAVQGAFTYSGQAAALIGPLGIAAGQGTFTLTGIDAAFTQPQHVLPADFTSFTYTGQNADLFVPIRGQSDFGAFSSSGQDITFTYRPVWVWVEEGGGSGMWVEAPEILNTWVEADSVSASWSEETPITNPWVEEPEL
jgi:hypothetical protein